VCGTGKAAGDPAAAAALRAGLAVAAAAAAEHAAGPGARANAGTGEVLRGNFLLLCDAVCDADAHLLADEETGFVAGFKARPVGAHPVPFGGCASGSRGAGVHRPGRSGAGCAAASSLAGSTRRKHRAAEASCVTSLACWLRLMHLNRPGSGLVVTADPSLL